MKTSRIQFGVRENTASSRQHAPRLPVRSSSSQPARAVELLREKAAEYPSEMDNTESADVPFNEPFVSADEAAQFLSVKRRYLLDLARRGIAGAYALGTGSKRKIWVFRLSELAASIVRDKTSIPKPPKPCNIQYGSPR